jgi:hypothetical protein
MNRRSFAALLPALAAGLPALAEQNGLAQTGPASGAAEKPIETGVYPGFTPPAEFTGRKGHSFFHGMLPTDIGCEAHVSYLAVGAQHEPLEKHKHSEIWLVREGKVELMLDGTSQYSRPATRASPWPGRCTGCGMPATQWRRILCSRWGRERWGTELQRRMQKAPADRLRTR